MVVDKEVQAKHREFQAKHRYARISTRKARTVADLVRGLSVNLALEELSVCHRRASPMIQKVIRSAFSGLSAADLTSMDLTAIFLRAAG